MHVKITIEGDAGVGKTTIAKGLSEFLRGYGYDNIQIVEEEIKMATVVTAERN